MVHVLLSASQVVLAGWNVFGGHAPDVPEQLSAMSQTPEAGRQMVVAGWKPSTQCPAPSQESVASHAPPLDVPVQLVVDGWKPSDGHAPDVPVQLSATSHCPVDARQMVVEGWKPSTQFPAPSQESVASHAPPLDVPVQVVVEGANPFGGQSMVTPSHDSAMSHCPADGRQIVVEGAGLTTHALLTHALTPHAA